MNNPDHAFAVLAERAYEKGVPSLGPDDQLVGVYRNEKESVEAMASTRYVQRGDEYPVEHLVISIPGTEDIRDGARDMEFQMSKTPFGMGHTGFWEYYLVMREWILDMIADHSRDREVAIDGHSLGGAAAVYAALDTQSHLLTFGCPTPGDSDVIHSIRRLAVGRYVARYYFATDPIVWGPGFIANSRFSMTYDYGPWKGGGRCLGMGRHRIKSYVKALA
jgi:hypothetical protein